MMIENSLEQLAEAMPAAELQEEIQNLKSEPLAQQGPFDVYLEQAAAIPKILLEIGRLRELTFRTVGVGVGKSRDTDRYDDYYSHLFLWDRENHRVAGGYRIARTDLVFAEHGFKGLYTGFVARYPRYHKLFGAVTISDDYTSISQDLIVRFLRRTKTNGEWSDAMRALLPFKNQPEDRSQGLTSIEEVSAQVASQESDGKGVPVLLRQYFKLNATLLDFAYDAKFGDCLDAIVLVDLRGWFIQLSSGGFFPSFSFLPRSLVGAFERPRVFSELLGPFALLPYGEVQAFGSWWRLLCGGPQRQLEPLPRLVPQPVLGSWPLGPLSSPELFAAFFREPGETLGVQL